MVQTREEKEGRTNLLNVRSRETEVASRAFPLSRRDSSVDTAGRDEGKESAVRSCRSREGGEGDVLFAEG